MDKREIKLEWYIYVERCTDCVFLGHGEFTPICKLSSDHKHILYWHSQNYPEWCPLLKKGQVNIKLLKEESK